ncbi:AGAP003849-PB-like protein [Anopheles sinensis]|uniref:AGAP003849-PB-like protein n=1 Tax=Anopheles sinensis TaxID=74873 RepID=A0A084VEF2_ANOSI|nr:AGAP003849-PB-like protein [Anopheles sinensis]
MDHPFPSRKSLPEKADLKSRSDSTSVPPLDSIYTTPTGFHSQHHHHHHPHHGAHHPHQNGTPGSPEAMKQTPNSETDCTVKESLTDGGSTAGSTGSPAPGEGRPAAADTVEGIEGAPSQSQGSRQGEAASASGAGGAGMEENPGLRLPTKVSDYGLERFNRLLDRLDRGNFLIKTSFKKSYSLILMSRSSAPAGDIPGAEGGEPTKGNNSSSSASSSSNSSTAYTGTSSGTSGGWRRPRRPGKDLGSTVGGSLRGWYPKARGALIKANSSSGLYQLTLGSERSRDGETVGATTEKVTSAGGKSGTIPTGSDTPASTNDSSSATAERLSPARDSHPAPHQEVAPEAPTSIERNYNGVGLTQSGTPAGERDCQSHSTNESEEFCRSEVYDNDSGSGGRTEPGNRPSDGSRRQRSPRKAIDHKPTPTPHGNYENIRPSAEEAGQRGPSHWCDSRTLGHSYRKSGGRRKSNTPALTWGAFQDDDNDDPDDGWSQCEESERLSMSLPHATAEFQWQSSSGAVPIQFFQRQDYIQPTANDGSDFPADHLGSEETGGKRQGKKRWLGGNKKSQFTSNAIGRGEFTGQEMGNKIPHDRSFQLPALFGPASGGKGRPRPEKVPQLKNINLHFPNKTSLQQLHQKQQQQDFDGFHPQHELTTSGGVPAGAVLVPPPAGSASHRTPHGVGKSERKYFNKAKSHFLKLGQKCRLVLAAGGGAGTGSGRARSGSRGYHQQHHHHQHISSYNLDDLIKATHKYEENESANLSQKIVYKSYKSELDLTKNLAYLDSFLNEHFDQEQVVSERRQLGGRNQRHKRAKSCTKSLHESSAKVSAMSESTVETATSNLIQLEDVWSGGTRGQWAANNTSSSSSEYLRNNLSTARALAKPEVRVKSKLKDFLALTDGTPLEGQLQDDDEDEEDDDDEDDEEEEEQDDDRMLLYDATGFTNALGNTASHGPSSARTHGGVLVEQYGKNNATSSSLSSSDYASVYSATSSGNGASKSGPMKLLATPEEAMSGEHLPTGGRLQQSARIKQQLLHTNNATNPFVAPTGGENLAGKSIETPTTGYAQHHRIYNNFLEPMADGTGAFAVPVSPKASGASRRMEKNHRLRSNTHSIAYASEGGRHLLPAATSPRGTRAIDRYDYRVQSQTQHPTNTGSRPMAAVSMETDLTYQEDYLEHYQHAAARALRSSSSSVGGDRALQYLHRARHRTAQPMSPTLRHSNPTADPRNNGPANENSTVDSDDPDHEPGFVECAVDDGEEGSCIRMDDTPFDADVSDEMLLLVSAPIDIRRNNAPGADHPFLGSVREKSLHNAFAELQQDIPAVTGRKKTNEPLTGSDSGIENDGKHLLSYQPQGYDLSSNQLFNDEYRPLGTVGDPVAASRHRSTTLSAAGLGAHRSRKTSPGGKGPSAMGNSFLNYGPHRVIVSQSHKERGEVVLEYEC